ncbi:MAG: Gfo/Idh/MocA family oxidoreductase [Clostridia bacterium]|nr:Gfo/Idh/MocA family oxidoreductase [Clostridia bacterium]
MNKVKMGIIGFGNMGKEHVKNIYDGKIPNMELAAVCDMDDKKIKLINELYPDVTTFSDVEDMYKSGLIDSVLIATPHYDHAKYAIMGFDYGLNVLTEKPAGVHTKQVKEMNEAAAKSDKVFGIMYNQRTNPLYQKVKELIENGTLGHIKRITWIITTWYRPQLYHNSSAWRSTWKGEGGGTLINQNPHQLDLWQWMFGMPDKVYSRVSYGKFYDIEVEDEVVAMFDYDNGTIGQYITSTGEAPGTNRLEIACDMGRVIVERSGGEEKLIFDRNVISEREYNANKKSTWGTLENWKCEVPVNGAPGEQHIGILKNFANAVLKGEKLIAPGE